MSEPTTMLKNGTSKTVKSERESKVEAASGYLSESDDDFNYEEVPESDDEDLEFLAQDTLASIEQSLKRTNDKTVDSKETVSKLEDSASQATLRPRDSAEVKTIVRPSVVDDFIRNFLSKMKMYKSLDSFNTEWYELMAKGKLRDEDISAVPDIYLRNEELDEQVKILRDELERVKVIANKAQSTWDKFRKERNFHRMHHQRVVQEKNRLVTDIKRLKKHFSAYEPTIAELKHKYELAMKEKMLMRLERDRLLLKSSALEQQISSIENEGETMRNAQEEKQLIEERKTSKKQTRSETPIPLNDTPNPYADSHPEPANAANFQLSKTFKGHLNSVAGVAFHPRKNIVSTSSDDATWKMWSIPAGELIMSGEGHGSWVAGIDFNPIGDHLVSCSGDGAVKIWNFAKARCTGTFQEHTQAVWDVAYHHTGDFVATASMDQTVKLLDVNYLKMRQTLRGHVDSVNAVVFQPYSNQLCTASGDKTVSLWDIRSGLCIQTFYGHTNACNGAAFNIQGDTIASCDSDGVVKVWDVRMIAEISSMTDTRHALNSVSFDASGTVIASASDDGSVKLFGLKNEEGSLVGSLQGHDDAVQVAKFNPSGTQIVSGGSDCTFRLWNAL